MGAVGRPAATDRDTGEQLSACDRQWSYSISE